MEDYDDQHIHIHFDVRALNAFVAKLVSLVSSDGSILKLFVDSITVPITNRLQQLEDKMADIAAEITQLKSSVANLQTVDASAVTLLQGINAKYQAALDAAKAAGATDAQLQDIQDLIDQINTQNSQLAAAVSANTPAPPSTISGGVGDTTGGAGSSIGGAAGDTTGGAAGGPTVSGTAANPDTTAGTVQTTV